MSWKTRREGLQQGEVSSDQDHSFAVRSSLTRLEMPRASAFLQRYVEKNRPVIIEGAMDSWPALRCWNDQYLSDLLLDLNGEVIISRNGLYPDYLTEPSPMTKMDMSLVEFLQRASNENVTLKPILCEGETYYIYGKPYPFEKIPKLHKDAPKPEFLDKVTLSSTALWMSTSGCITPLHYDLINGLLCQVRGRKQVYLFPPTQLENLYPRGDRFPGMDNYERQCRVDIHHPDLNSFPQFAHASAIRCTLEPGQMLFIPSNWLHEVETLEFSISVGFSFAGGTPSSELAAMADLIKDSKDSAQTMVELQKQLSDNPERLMKMMQSPEFQELMNSTKLTD